MQKRFHIKPDGNIEVCNAKQGNCPFGDESNHYPTEFDAFLSVEYYIFQERMEQEYGYYENSKERKENLKNIKYKESNTHDNKSREKISQSTKQAIL
jgi:hypothetical protein